MAITKPCSEKCQMINIPRSRSTALMTLILSLLALYASLQGVFNKTLYLSIQMCF